MLNEAAEEKEALDVNPLHKEAKTRQDKLEFLIITTTDNEKIDKASGSQKANKETTYLINLYPRRQP